jgi:hypothetical protein
VLADAVSLAAVKVDERVGVFTTGESVAARRGISASTDVELGPIDEGRPVAEVFRVV